MMLGVPLKYQIVVGCRLCDSLKTYPVEDSLDNRFERAIRAVQEFGQTHTPHPYGGYHFRFEGLPRQPVTEG